MSDDPLLAALIRLRDRLDAVEDEFREGTGELRAEIRELRAKMPARFDHVEDKLTRLRDEFDLSIRPSAST